jgi:DedD protein
MDTVNVRNLEQIQESDATSGVNRLTTLFLASLGGAALVIAAVMTMQRSEPPATSAADPLAALVAKAKEAPADATEVDARDVTFPQTLSDHTTPTTALVAVKDARGRLLDPASTQPAAAPTAPPPAADQLPVVPLPAGTLLTSTPVTQQPKDGLSQLAAQVATPELPDQHVSPGAEGGFQLQVASFKDMADADRFVAQLRTRGHRAYRQAAYVADRGLWHRVRIGPFGSKYSAEKYQKEFEATEKMPTFVVDPDKVKRQEEVRRAKAAAQKQGR